jgi:hypothetical protein
MILIEQPEQPGQRAVQHMRQLRHPQMAWCGEPMPEQPPSGLFDTCQLCIVMAGQWRSGGQSTGELSAGSYPP